MRSQRRILLIALVVATAGCGSEVTLELPPGLPLKVTSGDLRYQYSIAPGSADYLKFQRWIAKSQSGWSRYRVTAPICGICVSASNTALNFLGDSVVLSIPAGMWQKRVSPVE